MILPNFRRPLPRGAFVALAALLLPGLCRAAEIDGAALSSAWA
ncbi:MAG: hypothetical protein RLZZ592_1291, partial [Pseudomonadota bacterium]